MPKIKKPYLLIGKAGAGKTFLGHLLLDAYGKGSMMDCGSLRELSLAVKFNASVLTSCLDEKAIPKEILRKVRLVEVKGCPRK
jgi:hypothetical protein